MFGMYWNVILTLSDSTLAAEGLGDFLNFLGVKGRCVSKNIMKNVLRNAETTLNLRLVRTHLKIVVLDVMMFYFLM